MGRHRYGLGVGALLVMLCTFSMPRDLLASDAVGKVVAVTGRVMIYPSGASQGRLAAAGTLVYEGDTLQAEVDSRAKLLMVDDSILTISQNTRLNLQEYSLDKEVKARRSLLQLVKGKIRLLISKLFAYRSDYQIRTATAVMGVRGTSPVIWTDPDPDCAKATFPPQCGCIPFTALLNFEGEMGMSNILPEVEGEAIVRGGWISLVCERQPPTEPRLATAEEIDRALEGTVVPLIPGQTFLMEDPFFAPASQAVSSRQEVERALLETPAGPPAPETPGGPGITEPDMTQGVVSTEPLPQGVRLPEVHREKPPPSPPPEPPPSPPPEPPPSPPPCPGPKPQD